MEEILGYHLEQAAKYRREVGLPDDSGVARRAAELARPLGASARTTAATFPRAQTCSGQRDRAPAENDAFRVRLLPSFGFTLLLLGELESAEAVLARAQVEAEAAGDEASFACAWGIHVLVLLATSTDLDIDAIERRVNELLRVAEREGHGRAVVALQLAHADIWLFRARFAKLAEIGEVLLVGCSGGRRPRSRLARDLLDCRRTVARAATGERKAPACGNGLQARAQGPLEQAAIKHGGAGVLAMQGRFDEARRLGQEARATFLDVRHADRRRGIGAPTRGSSKRRQETTRLPNGCSARVATSSAQQTKRATSPPTSATSETRSTGS